MSIQNELSSEIAIALLTRGKTPQQLHALKELVMNVRLILQETSTRDYEKLGGRKNGEMSKASSKA